jgi:DNA-binding Xre family transcriptional regulator
MAQTHALVGALKQVLKSRSVTYAEIARRLGMSEASIKRVFARETFTLERLDRMCGALGIEITDLAKIVEHEAERVTQLTLEQER